MLEVMRDRFWKHQRGDAETPRCHHAEADQAEHVEVPGAKGQPRARQQRPARPEDDGHRPHKLHQTIRERRNYFHDWQTFAHREHEYGHGEDRAPDKSLPHVAQFAVLLVAIAAPCGIEFQRHAALGARAGLVGLDAFAHRADVFGGAGRVGGRMIVVIAVTAGGHGGATVPVASEDDRKRDACTTLLLRPPLSDGLEQHMLRAHAPSAADHECFGSSIHTAPSSSPAF